MKTKIIASLMAAIMAAITFASPALSATALSTYPNFLGKSGDFYIVVGANAATVDVAGAIDIASNLAQLSYKDTSITGTTSSDLVGTERKVLIPTSSSDGAIAGITSNQLPETLRNFHYSGLKEGKYTYLSSDHNYHEAVVLPNTNVVGLTHSLGTPINGTLKMKIDANTIEYRYVFDDAIAAADFSYTSPNGSSYTNPLRINLAGQDFSIVAIPDTTSFKALVGSVGWVEQQSVKGLTAGELTAVVDTVYSGTQASIRIIDTNGNTITNLGVVGTTSQTFSYGGSTYSIKVLQTATVSVAGSGQNQAQLVFGKGDIEKVYDGSTTATISTWGNNWVISGHFSAAGTVSSSNYISVKYNPSSLDDSSRYFVAGGVFYGPGNYFALRYSGYYPDKFAKVTVVDSGSVTLYNSTIATGYSTISNLRGLKISSDVAGSLVVGANGYSELYVLYGASPSGPTNFDNTPVYLAYKDTVTGRIVNVNPGVSTLLVNGLQQVFTLSYGGPGATSTYNFNVTLSSTDLIDVVTIDKAGVVTSSLNFASSTVASTSSPVQLRLGITSNTVDTDDAKGKVEGTLVDISSQPFNVITDEGVMLYSVKGNVLSDKMEFGISPEPVYGLVQFGRIGPSTTSTGGTFKEVVPVTTGVAKLDSEITATDKTAKNLILVGGPCVNTLAAELVASNKLAGNSSSNYACTPKVGPAWNASTGYIIVVDNGFVADKKVILVAGTSGADTKLASTMLQQYATKFASISASSIKISGTAIATATITPI